MRAYRAYLLDEAGLVMRAKIFEARSDEEAAQIATAWAERGRLELWSGSRAIAIEPRQAPSQNSVRFKR